MPPHLSNLSWHLNIKVLKFEKKSNIPKKDKNDMYLKIGVMFERESKLKLFLNFENNF